jgi:hypothetical protein
MFSRRRTCSRPNPAGGATRKKRSFKKEVTEMDKILTPVPESDFQARTQPTDCGFFILRD